MSQKSSKKKLRDLQIVQSDLLTSKPDKKQTKSICNMSKKNEKKITPPLVKLLGPTILKNDGTEELTTTVLTDKTIVGLYFSAHWCGPCRTFTPNLSKAYKLYLHKKGLEIVFISRDSDSEKFKEYFGEMPWTALPFNGGSKNPIVKKLCNKFKMRGIPSFVLLDAQTGEILTKDGREKVINDPRGQNFPWKTPVKRD